ncbi:hypothetical protein [Herbidospora sp. RD11066]
MKWRNAARLLVVALVAGLAFTTAGPTCRVRPLTDAERAAVSEAAYEEIRAETAEWLAPSTDPVPPWQDSKPGVEPAIGIEIVDPTVCVP